VVRDQALGYPARVVVIARNGVAVQQEHRGPLAPVTVMQLDAVDLDERSGGRMLAFRRAGDGVVDDSQNDEDDDTYEQRVLPSR
jgi:hypothetical protein